jgi:hypothetical protein
MEIIFFSVTSGLNWSIVWLLLYQNAGRESIMPNRLASSGCKDMGTLKARGTFKARLSDLAIAIFSRQITIYTAILYGYKLDRILNYLDSATTCKVGESAATPIIFRPLSTNITWPVTADERSEQRNAATSPTSRALSSFLIGAFSYE